MNTSNTSPGEQYIKQIKETVQFLKGKYPEAPEVIVILGSGLGGFAQSLTDSVTLPFEEIPHWPKSTVSGHGGQLVLGKFGSRTTAVMEGRVHLYEGYPGYTVTFGLRALGFWGAKLLLVTNSAGALNTSYKVGDLMLITNQIGLFSDDPSEGVYHPELGPLFYDVHQPYDPKLNDAVRRAAKKAQIPLREGVYILYRPCSYETQADVKAMQILGADAVGKSTVPEVLAARQFGMKVIGVSCMSTQMATSDFSTPLTHEEVVEQGRLASEGFQKLLKGIFHELPERIS